jgi:hypothetical protein
MWVCEGKLMCPFRGYIHQKCAAELGEKVGDEDYLCIYCRKYFTPAVPKPQKEKPTNPFSCLALIG